MFHAIIAAFGKTIFRKLENIGHMQVCEDQALYEARSARKTIG